MKLSSIVYIVFFIIIILFYLLTRSSNTSIHPISEEIPRLEEIINSTISYNISANLEIGANIWKTSLILTERCNLLYLINNISVLKCGDIYIKREKNFRIICKKYENGWDCSATSYVSIFYMYMYDVNDIKEVLNYILNNLNYTVVRSWEDELNKISAYCYNVTFYGNKERNNTVGNVTICFDRQIKFPIFFEIKLIYENKTMIEGAQIFYYKYEVKNLVVNPRYEDYSNILNPPNKVGVYIIERVYVALYNDSLNIPIDIIKYLEISEEIEEVILDNFNNSYRIVNCFKKENYLTCRINKTIEEFIENTNPTIIISTQNYKIFLSRVVYLSEK